MWVIADADIATIRHTTKAVDQHKRIGAAQMAHQLGLASNFPYEPAPKFGLTQLLGVEQASLAGLFFGCGRFDYLQHQLHIGLLHALLETAGQFGVRV